MNKMKKLAVAVLAVAGLSGCATTRTAEPVKAYAEPAAEQHRSFDSSDGLMCIPVCIQNAGRGAGRSLEILANPVGCALSAPVHAELTEG